MDLPTIIQMIVNVGAPVVITALVILSIWQNTQLKVKNEALKEAEAQRQSTRYADLGYDTILKALQDNKENNALALEEQEKVTARFDMAKRKLMTSALHESNAKRILYFAYHNGGADYEQNPFKRMSCETEVMTEDVPPIQNKYKDLFRTYLYTAYAELNSGNAVIINNLEDIKIKDPSFYMTMTQDAIQAFYAEPIQNERGNTFAFIAYCYSDPQTDLKIPGLVEDTAKRLEGLYLTKHQTDK